MRDGEGPSAGALPSAARQQDVVGGRQSVGAAQDGRRRAAPTEGPSPSRIRASWRGPHSRTAPRTASLKAPQTALKVAFRDADAVRETTRGRLPRSRCQPTGGRIDRLTASDSLARRAGGNGRTSQSGGGP